MLAEGRDESECEEGRGQEPYEGDEQVPVAGGDGVSKAAAAQAVHPGEHSGESDDVQRRTQADHGQDEGPNADAVPK